MINPSTYPSSSPELGILSGPSLSYFLKSISLSQDVSAEVIKLITFYEAKKILKGYFLSFHAKIIICCFLDENQKFGILKFWTQTRVVLNHFKKNIF